MKIFEKCVDKWQKIGYIINIVIVTIIVLGLKGGFMANLKYSRQRESIKQFLITTKEHPTADTVYMHVKEEFPNISLGTVYRNLKLLTELGEAIKITTPDGGDRFDGCVQPHNHFICTGCGRVLDLDLDMKKIEKINQAAAENFDGIIESSNTIFFGQCNDCIKKS